MVRQIINFTQFFSGITELKKCIQLGNFFHPLFYSLKKRKKTTSLMKREQVAKFLGF